MWLCSRRLRSKVCSSCGFATATDWIYNVALSTTPTVTFTEHLLCVGCGLKCQGLSCLVFLAI